MHMTQRKIVIRLAGVFAAILPATAAAAPAAAGAGASSPTTTQAATAGVAKVDVTAPAPPPPETPRAPEPVTAAVHVRQGGLLRFAFGSGFMFGMSKADSGATINQHALSFTSELVIGASLAPGLVLGAAAYGNVPGWELGVGQEPGFLLLTCPVVDGYPDPTNGFHLVGGPCFAAARFESEGSGVWEKGWGAQLGIGYEWEALWGSNLGKGWGLGLLARVQYANLPGSSPANPYSAIMPGLLISATWY
jgi:hypothetical protein